MRCGTSVHGIIKRWRGPEEPTLTKEVTDEDVAALALKLTPKEKADADLAYEAYKKVIGLNEQLDAEGTSISLDTRTNIVSLTSQVLTLSTNFTADQKSYYVALFASDADKEKFAAYNDMMPAINSTDSEGMSFIKTVVLGAAAGLFIAAVILALKYILTPVVKTEDDLRTAFGLPIIGTVNSSSDTSNSLIYSGISACAHKSEAKTVYLVSSSEDEAITANRIKMSSMFEGKDLSVVAKGSMLTDPSVIDEIVSSDGVILFEKIGKSLYEDIAREIELCNNYGVPILGTVVIR